ncbi:Peptidase S8/S53, subtilisin/kexin/sedolisin [Cordyceps fumosorosea ARSEF 2679]|uniref:tripeptidyl-peptidase II n=1 Tax=Cordyceps fumosorosea (strain ARSEF 2679) TaxID=1081104 RepID=A0A167PQF8_CORFA|nr:Peptidase S8/S53, subtilisin/kexin/sedolisin [Cordyceps fumosorosea ARSEF 2679]OAA56920.1 Peptidase S8/S53, subtilisin/kexin/sedolisin [Cordyceps fumosorosea ARSEF 2679]
MPTTSLLLRLVRGAACLAAISLAADAHPTTAARRLTVSLIPGDETLLPRTLHELSDPASPRHGRHLSREEAAALLEPSPKALAAVTAWLRDATGLRDEDIERRGQLLHATVSPSQSAAVLRKRAADDDDDGLSGGQALADEAVRRHIRAVYLDRPDVGGDIETRSPWPAHPRLHQSLKLLLSVDSKDNKSTANPKLDGCDAQFTPACLREKYQMKNIPRTSKKTILGVLGFGNQTAQRQDLDLFFKHIDPSRAGANFSEAFLLGGSNPQGAYPSGEANLDIQYAVALAGANVDVRFLSVGGMNSDYIPDLDLPKGSGFTEPYLAFATALAALPDADMPSVLSISYGVNEQLLSRDYARHSCDLFGQLAARGVSVVVASGDFGPGMSCQSNDGSGAPRFLPAFPATCPYVTAVGATTGVAAAESAMELSGGGFSEYFERPKWQAAAVEGYLAKHGAQRKGLYNEKGRGIPDVAALGQNYQIYNHGKVESADGTRSASAPVVAAMVAVINSLRAEKGRPTLGLLNPWLYQAGRFGLTE